MEYLGFGLVGLGGPLALIGWIWLLVLGFQNGGALWGILIFLFSGLAGLVFCIVYKKGWAAFALMLVGGLLSGVGVVPFVLKALENMPR
ncbi:MAG: hypothetical protein IPN69_22300 [Acidobacteria bacterium]|nr:hypothetical protein [Acidobacteriota bacterium]